MASQLAVRREFALFAAGCFFSFGGSTVVGDTEQQRALPQQLSQEAVLVEASGFSALGGDRKVADVHREALQDALRNAVIQAHVALDVETQLEDMRLKEGGLRSRAMGYVEDMQVREAGLMPYTTPPIYRVRVKATVGPLRAFPPFVDSENREADRWRSVVALSLQSNLSPYREHGFRTALSRSMRWCGITILEPEKDQPALLTEVTISAESDKNDKWLRVDWQIGFGDSGVSEQASASPPVRGEWLITHDCGPSSVWWQKMALRMTHDVIRMWGMPRSTCITFIGIDQSQVPLLSRALGTSVSIREEKTGDSSKLVAYMSLAGDPLRTLLPILEKAGLSGMFEPVHASMTRIDFKSTGSSEANEDAASGKKPS